MDTATATKIESLAASYLRARYTAHNNQLGAKTDRAEARMERICEQVEVLGAEAWAAFTKIVGH